MTMQTLLGAYALLLALYVSGFLLIRASMPDLKAIGWLALSFFITFLAIGLSASRTVVPALFSIVTANFLVTLSYALLHRSVTEVVGLGRRHLRFHAVCLMFTALGFLRYGWMEDRITLRIAILSGITGAQAALSAYVLLRHAGRGIRTAAYSLAAILGTCSLMSMIRVGLCYRFGIPANLLAASNLQAASVLGFTVLSSCIAFCFFWMMMAQLRTQLVQLAHTDPLTGLLNRRAFEDLVEREIRKARRKGASLSILLMDIDHFKRINDGFGHAAGDAALLSFARWLQLGMRGSDAVGRFGGEEFVALLTDTALLHACDIADRLRTAIASKHIEHDGKRFGFTVSFGVAELSPVDDFEELLRKGDLALYQAKLCGRNRVHAFESELQDSGRYYGQRP
jgi:diguanylate cyclase (GGDEF)-like protein